MRFSEYTTSEFFRGVGMLLAAAVGVAFVSRVAKNFRTTTSTSSRSGWARESIPTASGIPSSFPTASSKISAVEKHWEAAEGSHRCGRLTTAVVNILFISSSACCS
jgi:hypothetical protein